MNKLIDSFHNGIQGVKKIDSSKDGPIVGITACTHGYETVGIQVIDYLTQNLKIQDKLLKGKLYLILTNIKAYQKTIAKGNKENIRFIDENLNRCCSEDNLKTSKSYEVKRANELYNLLARLDIIFDIHSTSQPSNSILALSNKASEEIGNIFNTEIELIDAFNNLVGKPIIDITERNGGIGLAIETGCQEDEQGFQVGVDNLLRLLVKLGMISLDENSKKILMEKQQCQKIKIIGSIMMNSPNFEAVKDFQAGDSVKKGDIIATDGNKKILAEQDSIIVMPTKKGNVFVGEEYCLLGKLIK